MAARELLPSEHNELRCWLGLVLEASAVARASRQRLADEVAASELSDQEFLVLWLCDAQPLAARGQGELAAAIGVSAAQMSGLVERLRRRNLLRFERLGHDRRRQVWQLTSDGQTLLADLCRLLISRGEQLRGNLTGPQQQQLQALLQRWLPLSAENNAENKAASNTPDQGGPSSCAA